MMKNQIFIQFSRIFRRIKDNAESIKIFNWNYFFYLFLILFIFFTFISINSLLNVKNKKESQNFHSIVESKEFKSLGDYFLSKINSPYKEIKYSIQNNDSIEKILKKFDINNNDIKRISNKLKQKKLTNIYAGRELSLILKKLEDGSNTVVNVLYPINSTLSIEIRKSQKI